MRKHSYKNYKELSREELLAMPQKPLFFHYRAVRAFASYILHYYGRRCCEVCREYIGNDWEKDVGTFLTPVEEYQKLVLCILQTYPYVNFNKRGKNVSFNFPHNPLPITRTKKKGRTSTTKR